MMLNKWEFIHALSEVQTHDLSVQAIKAYASDHAATGTATSMTWTDRFYWKTTTSRDSVRISDLSAVNKQANHNVQLTSDPYTVTFQSNPQTDVNMILPFSLLADWRNEYNVCLVDYRSRDFC
jgi:hypothetical protein